MKIVASLLLIVLLGVMTASLVSVVPDHGHGAGMIDCAFMNHVEEVCPMSYVDHLGAWKTAFAALVPVIVLFMAVYAVATRVPWQVVFRIVRPPDRGAAHVSGCVLLRERDPLRRLFARGILHPKVY